MVVNFPDQSARVELFVGVKVFWVQSVFDNIAFFVSTISNEYIVVCPQFYVLFRKSDPVLCFELLLVNLGFIISANSQCSWIAFSSE